MTIAMEGKVAARKAVEIHNYTHSRPATAKQVLDITVLMGGPSTEREVSLISGAAIADALERNGHKVTRSDINEKNVSALDRAGIDVVFIALHGKFGESGEVQQLCEERHLRYIGSPAKASELAMDKWLSKQVFLKAGVPTPAGFLITKDDTGAVVCEAQRSNHVDSHGHADQGCKHRRRATEQLESLGLPVVLKPVDGGSSVDVTIAHTAAERDAAMADLLTKYKQFLAEQFIKGRELTVGILGDQALPIIEIVPDGAFYDYRAKYSDDAKTSYLFDHGISPDIVARLQSQALAAHRALGCRDMSRVDFILDERGEGFVLEINTIPGFTSHSLLPKAAGKVGIAFDQLVDRIALMAMER